MTSVAVTVRRHGAAPSAPSRAATGGLGGWAREGGGETARAALAAPDEGGGPIGPLAADRRREGPGGAGDGGGCGGEFDSEHSAGHGWHGQ